MSVAKNFLSDIPDLDEGDEVVDGLVSQLSWLAYKIIKWSPLVAGQIQFFGNKFEMKWLDEVDESFIVYKILQ